MFLVKKWKKWSADQFLPHFGPNVPIFSPRWIWSDLNGFQLQINELNVFQIQSVLTDDIWWWDSVIYLNWQVWYIIHSGDYALLLYGIYCYLGGVCCFMKLKYLNYIIFCLINGAFQRLKFFMFLLRKKKLRKLYYRMRENIRVF